MTKKPTTKEQLVDYLSKYISLGTYDKKFVNNLLQLNITLGKSVTTNQATLLDKIILRYNRQLAKAELNSAELVNLSWTLPLVESSPHYTEAHISIMNDTTLIVHSPYKKDFVKDLKEYEFVSWDRDNKIWSAVAAEHTLKEIVAIVNKHYDKVNYCPEVQHALDIVNSYQDMKYWNPTLVRINHNLYVVAASAALMNAIEDIPLNIQFSTLARLSRMGIRIDPALINDIHDELGGSDELLKKLIFSIDPHPKVEMSDHALLIEYLLDIEADMVVLTQWFGSNKSYVMELANLLKANSINHMILPSKDTNLSINLVDLKIYKLPVKINMGVYNPHPVLKNIAKNIQIVNSKEIYI